MSRIRGVPVVLYEKTQAGVDAFNRPVYEETPVTVENVLIQPVETTAGNPGSSTEVSGKKAVYTLGIPKGDAHVWEDRTVEFFGRKWHTFGLPTQGIDDLIPLAWNKKVHAEAVEG